MRAFLRGINRLSEWSGKIFSFLIWVGMLMLCWEVASRYIFDAPTIWAHGYTQRVFGSYFIMVGAFTLLRDGHVRIDLIIGSFPFRVKKFFDLLNCTFLLVWGYVLVTAGWNFFMYSWKFKEVDEMALAHPVYPVKFILVVGALLISLQALSFFIQNAISLAKGENYEP